MQKKYLVTTAIDYTNDVIHIGHAYEKILSDAYVRHLRGVHGKENVHYVTGTDEHGQKVEAAAKRVGVIPKEYTNEIAQANKKELETLNISFDRFIRTTDEDHHIVVNQFWQKVKAAGFIYEGEYTGLYCEGDEAFVTPSELVDGQCPNHPTTELKTVTEKNYFFKWEEFTNFLGDYIAQNPAFIPVEVRRNEMLGFLKGGLHDISISREKAIMAWGFEVPEDDSQIIYVWFDALINYLTFGLQVNAWDDDTKIVHFVGKDILRWHTLLWPAMLQAAGYKLPDTVVAHGFLGLNGQKISKSIGNVIRPSELVNKYGVDSVRYYLLRYTRLEDDADLDMEHFAEVYNADLANGLGNLVSRVAKLAETNNVKNNQEPFTYDKVIIEYAKIQEAIEAFNFPLALETIWQIVTKANQTLSEAAPWELAKQPGKEKEVAEILNGQIAAIVDISTLLLPFMPATAQQILDQFSQKQIKAGEPLFPRLV